ncbi:MAG TPA: translation elongation factor Ts [Phycisphaerae bacterium]|nr:translation elongation factor Ts [Phycisphaerae bacterium]
MAEITAAQVKALREETGLPMMECKAALAEAGGDKEQAVEILTRKHKGKMEARSGRETGEGRIAIYIDEAGTTGGIIELRCETAPVAKNELFVKLTDKLARQVACQQEASPSPDAILAAESVAEPGKTVSDLMTDVYGKLRETMKLVGCRRVCGDYLTSYVHHDGKTGVLIALDAKPTEDNVGLDLCHHAAFANPMAVEPDGVPPEAVEKVRNLAREVAISEGKPEKIIDKIVEGKVNAFYAEKVLMEQEHVKVTKTKVRKVLKDAGVNAVTELVFMKVGA